MRLHAGEPAPNEARVVELRALVEGLIAAAAQPGPAIIAIDGRSSNGKSTLAKRIAAVIPGAEVVHTDDIAWGYSRFGWDGLLSAAIIEPLRRGEAVAYRPPGWPANRPGDIRVSADAPLVVIEGVGAGRRTLGELFDAVIWVQSDLDLTGDRDSQRISAGELTRGGYNDWMSEEVPFQAAERTWARADVVLSGCAVLEHDPKHQVVVLE